MTNEKFEENKQRIQAEIEDGLKFRNRTIHKRDNPKVRAEVEQSEDYKYDVAHGLDPFEIPCVVCKAPLTSKPIHARLCCQRCYTQVKYYGLLSMLPTEPK